MVCICTPLGLHPPYFFPEKAGQGLRAHAVPGSPQGLPRRLHGHLRAVAPGRRPEPRFQLQLPDRRPAPGAAGRLPNTHLARPVRGRAHRRRDALRQPAAVVRGLRPVVDPQRRARAVGLLAVERVRQAVPRGPARRGRRPRPAACADGQSILDAVREQAQDDAVAASAPATATSSTSTSPASASWSSGWRRPRSGRRSPSRRSTPSRRRTSPTRPTSSARRGCWFDLIHLALQTDSTRLVTLQLLGTSGVPPIPGVSLGHHDLSHHGKDPTKIEQLKKLETGEDEDPARLPREAEGDEGRRRHAARPDDGVLQQQPGRRQHATASRTCRCCSPAAASSTASTWPSTRDNPPPLCNLYVTMLQRLGIEADKFGSSTGRCSRDWRRAREGTPPEWAVSRPVDASVPRGRTSP